MNVATYNCQSLRQLSDIHPLYFVPGDPFIEEVLIPGFQGNSKIDCMVGFFSSEILADLAPGLASYINNTENILRLVVSPVLRVEDIEAINDSGISEDELACSVLEDLILTDNLLEKFTLKCFSWLLSVGRIDIKVALMKNGIFHLKVWLFREDDCVLAVHGSSNATSAGIGKNIEQITISKSWVDTTQRYSSEKLCTKFDQIWENKDESCVVVTLPQAIRNKLLQTYNSAEPPSEKEFWEIYKKLELGYPQHSDSEPLSKIQSKPFGIPEWLQFNNGPFEHQGRAALAWCEAGFNGILEMATGSGKTVTALICAFELYKERKPLLIVVSAPYKPLISQWHGEIAQFGLKPVDLTEAGGVSGRAREISKIKRRFIHKTSDVESIVVSHDTLCDDKFKAEIEEINCTFLIIADEVHNLGRNQFINNPPLFFDFRLGLSATPVRQYDEDGTEALHRFFGPIVFRFALKEAIGRCLVEYEYYVHQVNMTQDEMGRWNHLTSTIKANSWRQNSEEPNEYLQKLLRDRRAILETAQDKIRVLESELLKEDVRHLRHTLIYASEKNPEQLNNINTLLEKHGVLFHQLTYKETANRSKMKDIIQAFQDGDLQVLTAMRVLDEGVDIPQIHTAFILASTTIERQWIQRRGRVLRTCSETNKTMSKIHDFVTLPADMNCVDSEARKFIGAELKRIQEFACLASNAGRNNGPHRAIDVLVKAAYLQGG